MTTQIELLKKYGLPIRGLSGQHFLIDSNIQQKIVEALAPAAGDRVLEIGPGFGALTAKLLNAGCEVWAVEKDRRFVEVLTGEYKSDFKNQFHVIHDDVLKADFDKILKKTKSKNWKVISNLPYYITAPILFKVLDYHHYFEKGIFMMQKEVAKRLRAVPGTKDYGRLTLGVRYTSNVRHLFDVSPQCFTPKPKVDSSVVEFDFHSEHRFNQGFSDEFLFDLIRHAFSQRRKTLLGLWASWPELGLSKEELKSIFKGVGLDEKVRAENLLLKDYMACAKMISECDLKRAQKPL